MRFGRWGNGGTSTRIKLLIEVPPKDSEEALQHGNALADTGNYPVGTDDCFNVGISGGCGQNCFVFKEGKCPEPGDIK